MELRRKLGEARQIFWKGSGEKLGRVGVRVGRRVVRKSSGDSEKVDKEILKASRGSW